MLRRCQTEEQVDLVLVRPHNTAVVHSDVENIVGGTSSSSSSWCAGAGGKGAGGAPEGQMGGAHGPSDTEFCAGAPPPTGLRGGASVAPVFTQSALPLPGRVMKINNKAAAMAGLVTGSMRHHHPGRLARWGLIAAAMVLSGLLGFIASNPPASVNNACLDRASKIIRLQKMSPSEALTLPGYGANTPKMLMMQKMLPLVRLESLASAQLLDAAAAGALTKKEVRQLMKMHQEAYCSAKLHLQYLPGTTHVPFGNVSVTVYADNDIVSSSLKGVAHTWETNEMQEMLWAMRQYKAPKDAAPGSDAAAPLVVDVGANIGWFMLNAAAATGRVVAFEAMDSNIKLLRSSLCANPWLAQRVSLYGTGLGSNTTTCTIISGVINKGDGHTVCGKAAEDIVSLTNNGQYESRGSISIRRLDDLLAEDVQVMKIDVEGYELEVLTGGKQLLQHHTVRYIMAECNTGIIGEAGKDQYLRFLSDLGYMVSSTSFRGPFLSREEIAAGGVQLQSITLYCVKA